MLIYYELLCHNKPFNVCGCIFPFSLHPAPLNPHPNATLEQIMDERWESEIIEYGAINITGFRILDTQKRYVKEFLDGWRKLDATTSPGAGKEQISVSTHRLSFACWLTIYNLDQNHAIILSCCRLLFSFLPFLRLVCFFISCMWQ